MKNLLKAEEIGMLGISIYFFTLLDYPWWLFLALILAPDISFLGYTINPKVGAATYNFFHHKGIAVIVGFLGLILVLPLLQLLGIILFAHSSLDRLLGYGLKYNNGFAYTHLGNLNEKK